MDLQVDTKLHERYWIIEKLGQGGMGAVYLAWDETLETRVAVKSNFNPAPDSVNQFLNEARLLAALRHPNLPRVTDYFVLGKDQYLVMDYIPGDDLGERIKRQGAQNINDVISWTSQLCSALTYMHTQHPPIIHRDIKPANIKINPDGEAILVDFGIAKSGEVQAHTAGGASGYTPGYAPPEQYGEGRTGPFSDQFALAATVYALLTGTKPTDSIQRMLQKTGLIPIKALNPQVPDYMGDAVLKALALNPADRFDSVLAFKQALDNPAFHLGKQVRESIMVGPPPDEKAQTVVANRPVQTTSTEQHQKKKHKRNILLGILGGLLVIGAISAAIIAFLFSNDFFGLIRVPQSTQKPTSTEALVIISTNTENPTPNPTTTDTPIAVMMTPEATRPEPISTPTTTPTETQALELVGESGMIVFASDRGEDDDVQIWQMRITRDQSGQVQADQFQQLTFDSGQKDQPIWSPDGSKIAYVAPGGGDNGMDIWLMDADGGNQINLTSTPGDEFDPVWAPDASLILFTHHIRDAGETPIYGLVAIRPDGSDREKISLDFVESDPTFSPDMDWMLYVISASSNDYLYLRGSYDDFQTPRGFDPRSIFGEFGQVSDPAWAPSGDQIAYTRHEGAEFDIILLTYDSIQNNGVRLPNTYSLTDTGADTDAAWSPDARWIAFTSYRDSGDPEIYIMTTTGRPQVNLTSRDGIDRSPNWKPVP